MTISGFVKGLTATTLMALPLSAQPIRGDATTAPSFGTGFGGSYSPTTSFFLTAIRGEIGNPSVVAVSPFTRSTSDLLFARALVESRRAAQRPVVSLRLPEADPVVVRLPEGDPVGEPLPPVTGPLPGDHLTSVPEPVTMVLLATGLLALGAVQMVRRRHPRQ